jgi:hypothetical protein
MQALGTLKNVPLRSIWISEASDFTPWLAQEENLKILGETIGIDLDLEAQEQLVGPFRADILCKDTSDGSWVLIENQLGKTDHTHLGQLLTYAAGLDAVTIIWVASPFCDEHRAALDWLNAITDERFRFFGLEIELLRIGNSDPAPRFNITSKPNDWTKSVKREIDRGALSETQRVNYEYWDSLNRYLTEHPCRVRPVKAQPANWITYSVGNSGALLGPFLNIKEKKIGLNFCLLSPHAKAYFDLLHLQKDEIEKEIGQELIWDKMPENKQSNIRLQLTGTDLANKDAWIAFHEWHRKTLDKFHEVFSKRIKKINREGLYNSR